MPIESCIVLIDDHAAVRSGYRRFIDSEHDLKVVGEGGNADEAFALLKSTPCDALVLDISMPGQSGLELIRRVKIHWPKLPIVVLSMHDSPVIASKAFEQGANGYVTKSSDPEELVLGLRKVLSGQKHVSKDIVAQGLDSTLLVEANSGLPGQVNGPAMGPQLPSALTPREVEVVRLLAEGNTIEQAAAGLGISTKTVSNNLSQIRQKLGVNTDFELAFWAWSHGLGKIPPNFDKR
ncbi:response regulator [Limnobacter sp.]|uniref:response regulator transcription factor n=1 Tax=Limnobacter sp. TaxID=2003368 RepID=UPI00351365FF